MGSGADDLTPMGYTKEQQEAASEPAGETLPKRGAYAPEGPGKPIRGRHQWGGPIETPTTHGEQPHVVHAEGSRAIVVGCTDTAVTVVSGEEVALAHILRTVAERMPGESWGVVAKTAKAVAQELGVSTRRRVGPDVETVEG